MMGTGSKPRWAAKFVQQAMTCRDESCLIWPFSRDGCGRGQVRYGGRRRTVAVVVCEAVNGPRPSSNYDASHLCENGRGGCVNGRHLAWETKRENALRERGKNPRRKLTEDEVRRIRQDFTALGANFLAEAYNINRSAIYKIVRGEKWGWLL